MYNIKSLGNNIFVGGDIMTGNVNKSIKCRVDSCKHHDSENFCKLSDIVVGAENCNCEKGCQTECMSFECM